MHDFRLAPADEFNHRPTADSNFNESVYVNGWDPVRQLGGWMRIGNRVNEGHAELQVCLYLPGGRVACQFRRLELKANDGFGIGGLAYSVVEPFKSVTMTYEGEVMVLDDPQILRDPKRMFKVAPRAHCQVEFKLTGLSPLHGGEPTRPDQDTLYGRDFSLGHFNQHTRTLGRIRVGDESWEFDGLGWRDHSWGPRYWTNIYFYRLFIANFGTDRGLMILKRTDRQGTVHRGGVLMFDGDYEEITDIDVLTDWTPSKDPERIRLGVKTARRGCQISGRVLTLAPLRNQRQVGDQLLACRIAEGFTEWQWDDGRQGIRKGIGITEYIEFLEDGEPVGWPV